MRGVHSEEEDFGGGEGVSMKIGVELGSWVVGGEMISEASD